MSERMMRNVAVMFPVVCGVLIAIYLACSFFIESELMIPVGAGLIAFIYVGGAAFLWMCLSTGKDRAQES